MKNKKLFAVCCGSLLYGALFSCYAPKGVDKKALEQQAIGNVFDKMKKEYNAYYLSQPSSDIKNLCLQFPDEFCVKTFLENRSNQPLNKEKK